MFLYWPCYRSKDSHIGLRIAVLAQSKADGQYSNPKANMTGQRPVTVQIWKHAFQDIFIIQLFVFNF